MAIESPHLFLDKIFHELERSSISLEHWEIDHICYRTHSEENYTETKNHFEKRGTLLIESEIGGRQIATYKLHEPLIYQGYLIDLVEVPAPKKGRVSQIGYEHIEVVIDISFEELIRKNPSIDFKTKAQKKDLNPEIEIEFDDCAIKFHHKSLEQVINIEKNSSITNFLEKTKLLQEFQQFSPCLSGSIPLRLQTNSSDLDILFSASNLDDFESFIKNHFKKYPNFQMKRATHQGSLSSIANFSFEGLELELFCSDIEVYKQQANSHLLIEARLMKVGGKLFYEELRRLRLQGLKTEPAFGKILGLTEPYRDLLELRNLTDIEIKERFFS